MEPIYLGLITWVILTAGIFVFSLWTFIGIITLKNLRRVQTIRIAHDYAYSFICESFAPTLGIFPSDHRSSPGADCIMITCLMRNVGAGPAKLHVEDIRVIIDGRTAEDSAPIELNFARLAQKGIRCGGIPRDITKNRLSGTFSCKLLYGPPDSDFVRRYTIKTNIEIIIDADKETMHLASNIDEETDEPYVSR